MEVKTSTLNNIGIATVVIVLIVSGVLLFANTPNSNVESNTDVVSTSGDTQIIDLTAKGGYKPSVINAVAGKETVLRVNTNNTFDCSSALTIPKLGVQKNLPPTGKTEISLGIQKAGTEIDGTCSMGMYSFKIKFT